VLPIAFKVRGGGNYSGTKGGAVRPNEKGGTGALWYIDKTFTIASTQDQFICAMKPIISPTITTCKGSRGGCSDEAIEEIKAVHEARQQQPFITKPQPMTTQPLTPQVPLRFLSVCSGMEAASVAWEPLGWKAVGFSEIEPFPCAVLAHRFPNTPNYGSLTEYQSWPLEPGAIDLLVGGTPCQSFSVAGLRKGLTDPRGNLALTFLGLADKLKPRWIVWENVPGVLSSNGGRDFGAFLGALVQLGYGFAYRVLDAQHFGVPQRRRRVFVVACLGDWRAAAEVLSLREGLRGYLETGNKKRKGPAANAGASVEAGCWWDGGQVSQTLDAVLAKGQTMPEKNRFPAVLTPVPQTIGTLCARDYKGVGSQYVQEGKCIPCPAPQPYRKSKRACSTTDNERVKAEASNTLNNFDLGDTRTTHAVAQQAIPIDDGRAIEKNQNGLGVGQPGDPAYTLDTLGAQAVAVPFRKSKRAQSTTDIHGVCHQMPGTVAPTIGASGPPYSRTGNERVEAEALAVTFTPHIVQASELRLRGQITEQDTCPTLLANTKSGDNDPLAVQAVTFQPGNLRRKAGADPSTEVFPTVKCDSGDQSPHVATIQVATFKPGNSAQARSIGYSESTAPTLEAGGGGNNKPAVMHPSQGVDLFNGTLTGDLHVPLRTAQGHGAPAAIAPTLTASNDPSRSPQSSEVTQQVSAVHQVTMAVRRLTPRECERLQGFPDDWSQIPWKGKPADQCPDGPRYKCAGNSMAVPVMRWIGEQIARVELSLNNPTK